MRIMQRYLGFVLLSAVLALSACEVLWDASNRGRATSDIQGLLRAGGLPNPEPKCHMVGTTRDVTCTLRASATEVATVARGLSLQPVEVGDESSGGIERFAAGKQQLCGLATRFGRKSGVKLFGALRRPPQLRLANGSAFEYLLLYHDAESSQVCLELSYSYG